jgi:hypothetical protein
MDTTLGVPWNLPERVGKDSPVLCCMFSFRDYPKENIQQSGYGEMVEWPLLGKN